MKICIISVVMPGNSKGGIEDHTFMLSQNLAKLGHKVTVITAASKNKEYEKLGNLEIYYLKNVQPKKFVKNYSEAWKRESLKKFLELNKKINFDIIHGQERSVLHLLNKNLKVPIIATLHTTVYDDFKTRINIGLTRYTIIRDILSILYCVFYLWPKSYIKEELPLARKSNGIIATSNQQEIIFKKIYKVKPLKVYNGIDASLFKPEKIKYNKFGIKDKDKIILAVARLERDKGIQYMIRAMPEIKDAKLIIVGDGSYKKHLLKLWKKSKAKDRIIFTGFLDLKEVKNLLNRCNLFVNSTIRQNGYDLIMAEAMACEKVVVSSNIGSTPTLIKDNKDGILFKTKSIKHLVKKVKLILNNPNLSRKIGKQARKTILKNFTSEIMAKNAVKAYQKVIKDANRD
jgi:glycosyltransferase involved in cell wall biosynthesis